MGDNTAYYDAEQALLDKIVRMRPDTLKVSLDRLVRRADPDFNRELFRAFGVVEQVAE